MERILCAFKSFHQVTDTSWKASNLLTQDVLRKISNKHTLQMTIFSDVSFYLTKFLGKKGRHQSTQKKKNKQVTPVTYIIYTPKKKNTKSLQKLNSFPTKIHSLQKLN